ncbi:MAG TPA: thiamine phosphate synthase [Candidatus Pelagibacter bacterium]|nr:thiamine phosphate synthase [Pelagibacteraceae bacterium]HJN84289.1 thiamine phosphate synthase [Candidatus Pelagibacter bacterium]
MKKFKNKKKFIYLISPSKIKSNSFYNQLKQIFNLNKVAFFQLRLKKERKKEKLIIGKKIQKLCKKYKVKYIINDDPLLAKKINADGCHLGQTDMDIILAKKTLKKHIIGITCHNSKKLIKKAIKNKASYIALGAFFSTKTKRVKYKANIKVLNWAKKTTNIPIVAIGGIKLNNYKKLLLNKANFLAISGYIWNNKKYKPIEAIRKLK